MNEITLLRIPGKGVPLCVAAPFFLSPSTQSATTRLKANFFCATTKPPEAETVTQSNKPLAITTKNFPETQDSKKKATTVLNLFEIQRNGFGGRGSRCVSGTADKHHGPWAHKHMIVLFVVVFFSGRTVPQTRSPFPASPFPAQS